MLHRHPKLIALAAGFASATGFAPLGLWPVTLICLALLMALVARAPNWRGAFVRSWLWGVGHFTLGLNWIAHAFDFQDAMPHWLGYGAVVALSLYLALYPGIAGVMAWHFVPSPSWERDRRASARERDLSEADGSLSLLAAQAVPLPRGRGNFVLGFAAAWIVTEYLRATLFTGFAWNPLGAIWVGTNFSWTTPILGTYGLSGLTVILVGAAATAWPEYTAWVRSSVTRYPQWLRSTREDGTWPTTIITGLLFPVIALLVLAGPFKFVLPLPPAVLESGPLLRIVQHNISQAERHDAAHDEDSVVRLERLSGTPTPEPRLIFWPEGAVPYFLEEERFARDRLAHLLGPGDLLLTGGDALIYDKQGKLTAARNSLFVLTPDGRILSRYDKAHLVPYGEYLPMRPILSAIGLARLVPGDLDFIPGPGPQTLALPGFGRMGVQICYEITFSGQVVDHAHRPDFIFNPSTDAWFGAWGPPQHLAQARLRAIEEGLPVIRSTPTGISAVIDADGRLIASLPLNKAGFIGERLPPPHEPTLFARYGNALPLGLALLLALLAVAPRLRRR